MLGLRTTMFGIPDARVAEKSRPNYFRDLAEYARLEYPQEDPRTVSLQFLESVGKPPKPAHRRFRFLRHTEVPSKAAPGNV
jgi:hypothetical protein